MVHGFQSTAKPRVFGCTQLFAGAADNGCMLMLEVPREVERLAKTVIAAAIEVHAHLGPGFLESVYEEAMAVELGLREIDLRRQLEVDIRYKGRPIAAHRLDLLVEDRLLVEVKAVEGIMPAHIAQTLSYLSACELELGLIINFNVTTLEERNIRRVVRQRVS
jgi:GxxExxY protein